MLSDLTGILMGLAAGFFAACSYLCSRHAYARSSISNWEFFGVSHLQMGVLSLLLLPLALTGPLPPWRDWILPLLGCVGFYMTGQCLLFHTLRTVEASVVSPLIGLKIPLLAVASFLFLNRPVTPGGWLAVLLCTLAGFLISPPHRLHHAKPLLLVLLVCCGYAGSDLCIPPLVRQVAPASTTPALLGVCLSYLLSGVVGLGVLCVRRGGFRWGHQAATLPFSLCWMIGIVALFACLARLGVVYGTMLQSTRGILNVVLGALIAKLGWEHLETLRGRWRIVMRVAGALLMTAAIFLYHLTRV